MKGYSPVQIIQICTVTSGAEPGGSQAHTFEYGFDRYRIKNTGNWPP